MATKTELPVTLSTNELRTTDAYWRACNYLSRGHDLSSGKSPVARAAAAGALQEPTAWALGFRSRSNIHLGSSESRDPEIRPEHDVHLRAGSWRARDAFELLSGRSLFRNLPGEELRRSRYAEILPRSSRFLEGLGSHCTPEIPGSIHEGGELGYSISHAFGAAFDNPDLIVSVVVGDGEAETGPLATSWHSNKFLNPIRDGAVLPILHLNGYKIANPTILARIPHEELEHALPGYGWTAAFRRRRRP